MGRGKKRQHNQTVLIAVGKLQQSLVGVSSGLAGVSRYLEALFELCGHTVDEARVILDRKDKEAQEAADAAGQSDTSNPGSSNDLGSTRSEADSEDSEGKPEGAA